jgi:hypothetical protein
MRLKKFHLVIPWSLLLLMLQSCASLKMVNKAMEKEPPAQSFASVRFSNGARADSLETTHRFYSFYELNKVCLKV